MQVSGIWWTLLFYIRICKFCSFRNPFATITSLSEIYFRFRRFVLLVISINYGSSISSWKPWRWVRLDLILTMRDIYINSSLTQLTKFSSSRSTEFNPPNFPKNITKIFRTAFLIEHLWWLLLRFLKEELQDSGVHKFSKYMYANVNQLISL